MAEPDATPLPTTYTAACHQVDEAQQRLYANTSDLPNLPWRGVHELTGPVIPGDLWVVGARPANGKTTFMLNLFDQLVGAGFPSLYIGAGSEGPPADLRRQWAALRLGYAADKVLEGRWDALEVGARDKVFMDLQDQATYLHNAACFADVGERLSPEALLKAMKEFERVDGARYVLLDHIHRIRFNARTDLRRGISEAIRWLRDQAAQRDWGLIVAAQLHRARAEHGALRDLLPPAVSDLKESGTLEEDAVVVLLLHRVKKPDADAKTVAAVARNERPITDILLPNQMAVRIGKHRRRGHVMDHVGFLHLSPEGRLTDQAPSWRAPSTDEDAYDRSL